MSIHNVLFIFFCYQRGDSMFFISSHKIMFYNLDKKSMYPLEILRLFKKNRNLGFF